MAALAGSVSRRYARALFSLGVDNGMFEVYGRELGSMARLYESSSELRQALDNPVFRGGERRAVLDAVLPRVSQSREVRQFVSLLLERGRLPFLPAIAREFGRMTDDRLGQVRGKVVSAAPLDAGTVDEVRRALESRTGKKVILETEVDPELLGGVMAKVGDLVLDGTLRTQLSTLSHKLLN
jgi:F-type H+-transporting ATPase subunit delta